MMLSRDVKTSVVTKMSDTAHQSPQQAGVWLGDHLTLTLLGGV
jgi:hypothetical protein